MKKLTALLVTVAAFSSISAFAQQGESTFDPKRCEAICKETLTADKLKKDVYDYEALQRDPAKSAAEKVRNNKDAVKKVCRSICYQD
jgi:hypothetical protein